MIFCEKEKNVIVYTLYHITCTSYERIYITIAECFAGVRCLNRLGETIVLSVFFLKVKLMYCEGKKENKLTDFFLTSFIKINNNDRYVR